MHLTFFGKTCLLFLLISGEPAHIYVGIIILDIDNINDAKMVIFF